MKKVSLIVIPLIAAALLFAVAVSSEPARLPFSDVPEDAWFYETVSEAYGAGLVKGKSETVFAPRDNVTRAEVAAMLSRLDRADVTEYGKNAEGFSDVRDGSWYSEYVGWATSVGILKGYPDGTARPGGTITRAEACQILYNLLSSKPSDRAQLKDVQDG
ncbi:MAG: S-layer homology domain-containing protein, partial [Clostridia bacterium]|nr:S-layer homology domain-containing protein [Clostridia bacterium]